MQYGPLSQQLALGSLLDVLAVDARSELKPSCRRRQRGGGYEPLA